MELPETYDRIFLERLPEYEYNQKLLEAERKMLHLLYSSEDAEELLTHLTS